MRVTCFCEESIIYDGHQELCYLQVANILVCSGSRTARLPLQQWYRIHLHLGVVFRTREAEGLWDLDPEWATASG